MRIKKQKLPESCMNKSEAYDRLLSLQKAHDKFYGLEYICYLLNYPQVDKNNKLFPQSDVVKQIIEDMSKQKPSKLPWVESRSKTSIPEFDPDIESPLSLFNEAALANPIILKCLGVKRKGKARHIEISTTAVGTPVGQALWLLWREYFEKRGWERLKQCPQCNRWFVDRARNRKTERCSSDCTWKWWSWGRRRAEGHKLPKVKIKRRKRDRANERK